MITYEITISLACYGRPEETKKTIESVMSQDMNGWELLIAGDNCPHFEALIKTGWFNELCKQALKKGNVIRYYNRSVRGGAWGTEITNANIRAAAGKYFVFLANDDRIAPNHLRSYYDAITNPLSFKYTSLFEASGGYDFVYFNSLLPDGRIRETKLKHTQVGHSEIIVRTSFLQQMHPHKPLYGQDWVLVKNMIKAGAKYFKSNNQPTYLIGHMPTPEEIQGYRRTGRSIEGWPWWKNITRGIREGLKNMMSLKILTR